MIDWLFAILCLVFVASASAFAPMTTEALLTRGQSNCFQNNLKIQTTALCVHDVAEMVTAAANNVWLATIDADIEAIPENEFATVFAGGIGVMFGGVLSTVVVGFILEKTDIYANLAAESYLETADDVEFWKGLSEEEKVMAEAALNRIKEERGEIVPQTEPETVSKGTTTVEAPFVGLPSDGTSQEQPSAPKDMDMFSDY